MPPARLDYAGLRLLFATGAWAAQPPDPQRARRGRDRAPSGASSTATGKPSERPSYAPAIINHRLSVVAGFYQHHARLGDGPATNPVPNARTGHGRRNAHHNPMEPWTPDPVAATGRTPRSASRAIPDELYERVFAALTSNRDRAIVSLLISSGRPRRRAAGHE